MNSVLHGFPIPFSQLTIWQIVRKCHLNSIKLGSVQFRVSGMNLPRLIFLIVIPLPRLITFLHGLNLKNGRLREVVLILESLKTIIQRTSILHSRLARSHAMLPPLRGEHFVTPSREAAKETNKEQTLFA